MLGLCMAPAVKKVVGVELCASAIEDAKRNAASNGILNAEFHASKVNALTFFQTPFLSPSLEFNPKPIPQG